MKSYYKVILTDIYQFLTNRVFILSVVISVMFYVLVVKLFELQIVDAANYKETPKINATKPIEIPAPRGNIYDRLGRPLAVNETTFCIKYDPSVAIGSFDKLDSFVKLMEKNGESLIDNLPFTREWPYQFDFSGSEARKKRFLEDMTIPTDADATKAYEHLRELFGVPIDFSDQAARPIIAIGTDIFLERYRLNQVTVALNVKETTVNAIEEQNDVFGGFYADVTYLRRYLGGENFSHVIGFIRGIDSDELEKYKELGYKSTDLIGKTGMEQAMELTLRGTPGERVIEIDKNGRKLSVVSETSPTPGNDVFLTLDIEYQNESAEILYRYIKQILINKLKSSRASDMIPLTELMASLVNGGYINVLDIMTSDSSSYSYEVRKILERNGTLDDQSETFSKDAKALLKDLAEKGQVSPSLLTLALIEQGVLTADSDTAAKIRNGRMSALSFIIDRIEQDELTPQMANVEPGTGSAVVVNVNDGSVIAAVGYPTYDNTQFVNVLNADYFAKISTDLTSPMIFRPFSETRAPGSTFKMITAMAGLESGSIRLNETIRDEGVYTKASTPYANCWTRAAGYHGLVNVRQALECSCNFFFYETSFRLGNNVAEPTRYGGIKTLNEYMNMFGLGLPTGIEIFEASPFIATPEYKEMVVSRDPVATQSQRAWTEGDTIRTAIGQSFNSYSAATMAKYFATIANGGTRYSLHFLDGIGRGGRIEPYEPKVEAVLDFQPENWKAIKEGMYMVTTGNRGTATTAFRNFPIPVAGKTGTAQQSGRDHASFGGYAPYENPEIAVYVCIPYGDTMTMPAPAALVARDLIEAYFKQERETGSPLQLNKPVM